MYEAVHGSTAAPGTGLPDGSRWPTARCSPRWTVRMPRVDWMSARCGLRWSRSPHARDWSLRLRWWKMVPEADGTVEAAMRVLLAERYRTVLPFLALLSGRRCCRRGRRACAGRGPLTAGTRGPQAEGQPTIACKRLIARPIGYDSVMTDPSPPGRDRRTRTPGTHVTKPSRSNGSTPGDSDPPWTRIGDHPRTARPAPAVNTGPARPPRPQHLRSSPPATRRRSQVLRRP